MFDLNVIRWFILIPLMSQRSGELIKNKPDGRMGKDYVLFVIQINIIGASDVDPYSSLYHGSVLVQAFSLNILQERFAASCVEVCCPSRNSGVPVQRSVQPDDKISQIRQRLMPRLKLSTRSKLASEA